MRIYSKHEPPKKDEEFKSLSVDVLIKMEDNNFTKGFYDFENDLWFSSNSNKVISGFIQWMYDPFNQTT